MTIIGIGVQPNLLYVLQDGFPFGYLAFNQVVKLSIKHTSYYIYFCIFLF